MITRLLLLFVCMHSSVFSMLHFNPPQYVLASKEGASCGVVPEQGEGSTESIASSVRSEKTVVTSSDTEAEAPPCNMQFRPTGFCIEDKTSSVKSAVRKPVKRRYMNLDQQASFWLNERETILQRDNPARLAMQQMNKAERTS